MGAYGLPARPRARKHRERPEQNALSRARLAGDRREAGAEIYLRPLEQREIFYLQKLYHSADISGISRKIFQAGFFRTETFWRRNARIRGCIFPKKR